jgi:hypothetical protein
MADYKTLGAGSGQIAMCDKWLAENVLRRLELHNSLCLSYLPVSSLRIERTSDVVDL